jgi:hypothetical protein
MAISGKNRDNDDDDGGGGDKVLARDMLSSARCTQTAAANAAALSCAATALPLPHDWRQ